MSDARRVVADATRTAAPPLSSVGAERRVRSHQSPIRIIWATLLLNLAQRSYERRTRDDVPNGELMLDYMTHVWGLPRP